MSDSLIELLLKGTWETIVMTFVSGFFGFLIGLPTGVLLFLTRKNQILEQVTISKIYPLKVSLLIICLL